MITSKKYSLNWRDALHGLLVAIGTGAVDALITNLTGAFSWKSVLYAGLSSGLLYVKVKLLTPAQRVTKAE